MSEQRNVSSKSEVQPDRGIEIAISYLHDLHQLKSEISEGEREQLDKQDSETLSHLTSTVPSGSSLSSLETDFDFEQYKTSHTSPSLKFYELDAGMMSNLSSLQSSRSSRETDVEKGKIGHASPSLTSYKKYSIKRPERKEKQDETAASSTEPSLSQNVDIPRPRGKDKGISEEDQRLPTIDLVSGEGVDEKCHMFALKGP
ncbi:uncharacterized protein LOC132817659 [Hemiscyllium ocellatum]|uniref:uncharacterized protein LOC132817659 n=1 Tax=Hemiscyllium ocellatum TaxID=170820 RepID=UPI002967639B|nr:uncharacterized protein LOC132817659 [Hemiscyllium ocellatum]